MKVTFGALADFCELLSSIAYTANMTWPFVRLPRLQQYMDDVHRRTGAELVSVLNRVLPEDAPAYVEFVTKNRLDWFRDDHMIHYGNLSFFDPEVPYVPFIFSETLEGEVLPTTDQEEYYPEVSSSPPGLFHAYVNYDPQLNYEEPIFDALKSLPGETLVDLTEGVSWLQDPIWLNYHDKLHSQIEDSETNHPHYQLWRHIREVPHDLNSKPVGLGFSMNAWDVSLRNILPRTVQGIYAVVKSNCGDSFTYRIDGPEAFFLGYGDRHEDKYDAYEISIDMAPHSHPDFETTPGHCIHKMVRRAYACLRTEIVPNSF